MPTSRKSRNDITIDEGPEIMQQVALNYQKAGGRVRILALGEGKGVAIVLADATWCQKHHSLSHGPVCRKCQKDATPVPEVPEVPQVPELPEAAD